MSRNVPTEVPSVGEGVVASERSAQSVNLVYEPMYV